MGEKLATAKRIVHLRNIRTMCDSTIAMMSQYEQIMNKSNYDPITNSSSSSPSSSSDLLNVNVTAGDAILNTQKAQEKAKNQEKLQNLVGDFQEQEAKMLNAKIEKEMETKERLQQKIADIKRKLAEKEARAQAVKVKVEAEEENKSVEPKIENNEIPANQDDDIENSNDTIDMSQFEKSKEQQEPSEKIIEETSKVEDY